MAKATHTGSCQCCGRRQMLPGGVLAKHGYTTEWGFFSGVCVGSGHKPFEQDFSLIEKFIASAEARLAEILATQAKLREPVSGPRAWIHDYKPAGWKRGERGGYVWREVDLTQEHNDNGNGYTWESFHYASATGRTERIHFPHSVDVKTMADAAAYLNGKRAEAYDKTIAEIRRYIAWQRERVATWKPGELSPVK